MAIPTFVSNGGFATGSSSVSPAWGSGHQAGDVAILAVASDNQEVTLSTPAGFTEVVGSPQGTGTPGQTGAQAARLTLFWCRATSGAMPAPTVADPGNWVVARISVFRGIPDDGEVPYEVVSGDVEATGSTAVSIPGGTTTLNDCLIVGFVANGVDSASNQISGATWTNASLSSVTHSYDGTINTSNGGGLSSMRGGKATAGAYSATTATLLTSSVQGRMSIALRSLALPAGDVTGSGSPTATLSASASGSATMTPDDPTITGSGSPTATLSASASGTATQSAGSGTITGHSGGARTITSLAPAPPAAIRTVNVSTNTELTNAIADATPGDHIILAAGSYSGKIFSGIHGTEEAPIVVDGSAGVTFTGTIDLRVCSWLYFTGFTISGAFYGIQTETGGANDCVFDQITITNIGQEAIMLKDASSRNTIQRCDISNTGTSTGIFGEGVYIGASSGTDNCNDNRILQCTFATQAEAIDIKPSGVNNTVVADNIFDCSTIVFSSGNVDSAISDAGIDTRGYRNTFTGTAPQNYVTCHGSGEGAIWDENTGEGNVSLYMIRVLSGANATIGDENVLEGSGTLTNTSTTSLPPSPPASAEGPITTSLSASASGTATMTPDGLVITGSGSPTKTLSASASGTATSTVQNTGEGAPSKTLQASASGTATMTPDDPGTITGFGSPSVTLVASVDATATNSARRRRGKGFKRILYDPSALEDPQDAPQWSPDDAVPEARPLPGLDPLPAPRNSEPTKPLQLPRLKPRRGASPAAKAKAAPPPAVVVDTYDYEEELETIINIVLDLD